MMVSTALVVACLSCATASDEERGRAAAYKQVCDDTPGEKQSAIKEANEMIEILQAGIQKYEADAAQRAEEIAKHDEDISTWEGDFRAASKVREIEAACHQRGQ